MFSHHSHSGDYIAHGVDPLECMVREALRKGFHTYCLTEHMPRICPSLLYPEEKSGDTPMDLKKLEDQFQHYLEHAKVLKNSTSKLKIIIGMEVEGCDDKHILYAAKLMSKYSSLMFCIGSVHHVNSVPIDYNREMWMSAIATCKHNLKDFLKEYFDAQYQMLVKLKPRIVGHIDLFRLYLPNEAYVRLDTGDIAMKKPLMSEGWVSLSQVTEKLVRLWPDVESALIRNLKYINGYDGLVEINTSALRKGLRDPYPHRDVGELVKEYAGSRFVLSDDAHAVAHIGCSYNDAMVYIEKILQLKGLYYLTENADGTELLVKYISIADIKTNKFWN